MSKRLFDLFLVLIALVICVIPFAFVYLLVKLTSRGPAVFWTKRIGKDNEFFMMPKFRTMYIDTPQVATHLLKDSNSYITPVGKILRKTSLDEIPQLWSIFKGDMSFVGPRPALFNQDDLKEMRTVVGVHLLVPGLTGWAQVSGRDEISLDRKVAYDKEYFDRKSFCFDLYIIYKTFIQVISHKDISH